VIDALRAIQRQAPALEATDLAGLAPEGQRLILVTAHRRENLGEPLRRVCRALREVDREEVDKLDVDGFLIRSTPEAVFLVGPKDWSTAYACFQFLEEFCDVRWFLPGELGEDVPTQETLSVPAVDRVYEPAYQHRQYSGFQWRDLRELQRWKMHARERARLEYHHNLYRVFDVTRYGKEYPDLYPIQGGKRRIPGPALNSGWQPCLTHPKAVDIAVEYAKEHFAKNPDAGSMSLGITDGGGYCECPRCMALVDPTLPPEARRSRWFFQFANAVAKRFDELFPDKLIGYLLYGECKQFPEGVPIHPRLIGFYVYPSFRLITPEGKQAFDEGIAATGRSAPCFGLYDWFYGDGLCIPRLQIRQAKYWLEQGYALGARHCKAEAYMNWGLDGLKYWMHTKLMWDPSLDVDALQNECVPRFFREAADPMRRYFEVVERYTVAPVLKPVQTEAGERLEPVNFHFRQPEQLESFPPDAVRACEPLLDEAEKLASSILVRERVRYFRSAFEVAKRMSLRYDFATRALPPLQKPESLPQGMSLLAQALASDLDVDSYYRWVLRGDEFCVRYPEGPMFGGTTLARAVAGQTLSQQIIDELAASGPGALTRGTLESTSQRVLGAALAGIPSAAAREVARAAVGPFAERILLCERAPSAPGIDGRLDDACWQSAMVATDFAAQGTGQGTRHRTEVRFAHDGTKLFGAFRCFQDTSQLLLWTMGRDARVWREDGVELLINRPGDTDPGQRFQAIISAAGNLFDYYKGSEKWDGALEVKTALEPQCYTIELSLPMKEIDLDPGRDRFVRVNMVRNFYGQQDMRPGEPVELSSWYLTSYSNFDPRARGWLIFN